MDWGIVLGTMVVVVGGGLAMTLWWRRLAGADAAAKRTPGSRGTGNDGARVVTIKPFDAPGDGASREIAKSPGGAPRDGAPPGNARPH